MWRVIQVTGLERREKEAQQPGVGKPTASDQERPSSHRGWPSWHRQCSIKHQLQNTHPSPRLIKICHFVWLINWRLNQNSIQYHDPQFAIIHEVYPMRKATRVKACWSIFKGRNIFFCVSNIFETYSFYEHWMIWYYKLTLKIHICLQSILAERLCCTKER